MSGANRIAGAGRLTPARTARFTFDDRSYTALAGDTLASALIANGVHLVGRSFKYHRPRGFLSAGAEEPNALVGVERDSARRQPNVRATVQEVFDGLNATSQNRWPSLAFDVGAINDRLSPMFAAGFYYKTFMWPKEAWKQFYEPKIRAAAGLGVAPGEPDPDHYASRYVHCDVLVIGGGVAGLSAALAAAESGARVILCDEQPEAGGALHHETEATIEGAAGFDWAQATAARLAAMENVRVLTRTTAFGYYAQNFVGLAERVTDHLRRSGPGDAARASLAGPGEARRHRGRGDRAAHGLRQQRPAGHHARLGGAHLPQPFRRGGRLAGSASTRPAIRPISAAFDLKRAGVSIEAIVDTRDHPGEGLMSTAADLGIEVLTGHAVTQHRRVAQGVVDVGAPGRRRRRRA